MTADGVELCRESIARHSKSFSLAARLLPGRSADEAAIVYAWCRRADDAVDGVPPAEGLVSLKRLRAELAAIWAGDELPDPELAAFQEVALRRGIQRAYAEELLLGMEMDCRGERYRSLEELVVYCYRVAGVVGLMMCAVFGVRDPRALRRAAHMGIAMQLTNICRDVLEDWQQGRLYVPEEILAECGAPALAQQLGGPFPASAREPMALAVRRILREAEGWYASGDRGLAALDWRTALAVRVARDVYAAIGRRIERQGCDVLAGRAWVPGPEKLARVVRAALLALLELPARALRRGGGAPSEAPLLRFPEDVLPLSPGAGR